MSGWLIHEMGGGTQWAVGFYQPPARVGDHTIMTWYPAAWFDNPQDAFDLCHRLNGGNEAQLKLVVAELQKIATAWSLLKDLGGTIDWRAVAAASELGTPLNKNLLRKVDELPLSTRSLRGLKYNDVAVVADLVKLNEAQLMRAPNLGRVSVNEIKEVLAQMGLRLDMINRRGEPS